jgi:hypothetical protein
MFDLYFVKGEMWQKRYPTTAYGQHFEDQWRRLMPFEPVFKARITYLYLP